MPFTGNEITLYDWTRPIRERHSGSTGPYVWRVPSPDAHAKGRGFYLANLSGHSHTPRNIACDARGSSFRLRLTWANDCLPRGSRLADTLGYFTDEYGESETIQPIVAILPRSRGFLAGWTMGEGMASEILYDATYDTAEDAARAAHGMAEYAAEREREYQAAETARMAEEERAAEAIAERKQESDTLEALIDRTGLAAVLERLAGVCDAKASHLRENWQDDASAKAWRRFAKRIDMIADSARQTFDAE